ncbi:Mu transposase C-terminal domain-containing protein [Microbacterium capsulatum]|uniref:Mu transposase C-terminal domain-containing protein n=1 Tax=Microbacterium capsulatum TaxID=3041921 RepID=A0ABU0XIT8_9MICO|nr:Mu transposase C-terminal domain-containing protein [Microbacterium sp. ASV81]MDQ4215053.1 Mu transposase C-terminal domain-containing protein [Microbacterium sp. ASV81]
MSQEYKLRLGDSVEIEGETWVWEGVRRGVDAKLRREGTDDDWQIVTMPELLARAGTARRESTMPLRNIAGNWPTDVLDMERHLLEVFRGTPMDPTATGPRPAYDLTRTTQEQRIATKVEELAGTSLARSRKALFNFWKEYQSTGVAGVDARLHRKGRKRLAIAKADPRLVAVIDRELDSRVNMPTSSRRHCAALVRRALEAMYPGDQICAIKDTTLQGYINERDAGRYSFAKSTTRRTSANSPVREYFSRSAHRLGAVCEIDSTTLDVQVWDEKGTVFRPTVTALFCVASRVPLAWAIHADSPNGFDHALLLARAIVGRRAIPGSGAATLSGSATLPVQLMKKVNPYLDDESLAVPWIFPHAITVDGGADFRSATFEAACRAFGITVVLAPPNAPTVKPHVERNFGTTSSDFATWLAGSTGNSVSNRGKRDAPTLTLDSVRLAFDVWITTVFLNKQHGGLKSPLFPGREWTPNQMYAALFEVGPGVQLPFRAEDFFALLPTERRVISKEGIDLHNHRYDSPLLADLRNRSLTGAAAGSRHARQFDIRFDPYNTNAVWVQHPETEEWIECWDEAIDDKGAWMAAETEVRLVERFGYGEPGEAPKTAEFLDEIERRARSDKRARNRYIRETRAESADAQDADAPVTEPAPIELREWADPVDVDDIDWESSAYDIVTVKEILP